MQGKEPLAQRPFGIRLRREMQRYANAESDAALREKDRRDDALMFGICIRR